MTTAPASLRNMTRQDGFTLIELLVSLAILSLTATLLLAGVVGANAIARRTAQREAVGVEIAAAQLALRDRIEKFRPVQRLELIDPLMDVRGNDHLFEFYSTAPASAGAGSLTHYRLLLTAPGELVLYGANELDDRLDIRAPSVAGWKGATLLTGVKSIAIAYYGATPADRQRRWRSFWEDNSQAPTLVRIRLAFADGDRRSWPDLVVRPGTNLDVACDPEAAARHCKSRG